MKKAFFTFLIIIFVMSISFLGVQAQASADYSGKLVKMENLSSVYYVASDGKRYAFPNENVYKTWFLDYDDVVTIPSDDLSDIRLGGNVVYRPGIVLVKITADPKVYAVSRGGVLRWVKTEAAARALYGENWNRLVDDVPDAFFNNYEIGDDIEDEGDFDPDDEVEVIETIDANFGFSSSVAKRAHTRRCQMSGNSRACKAADYDDNDEADDNDDRDNDVSDDDESPYITDLSVSNGGEEGYIDANDQVVITFNEQIDPASIHPDLELGSSFSSLTNDITGAINVADNGILTIKNIASFDIGKVESYGDFLVQLFLSSSGKVLTITIIGGDDVEIEDEDFDDSEQIGGTIKDLAGNAMEDEYGLDDLSGTFGGENINDGIPPIITSIQVLNNGSDNYIDAGDEIIITFSEEIDPGSINNDLVKGGSVEDVDSDETGGVEVDDDGILTIEDIALFYVGDVDNDGEFQVKLSLDSYAKELTITLTDGSDIALENEDLDDAEQIGDVVEDRDGNEMEDDPRIDDPTGTFVGDTASGNPYITDIKIYNYGYTGFIDEGDKIVITFSEPVKSTSINNDLEPDETVNNVDSYDIGGVQIDEDGILTVTDIVMLDVGDVGGEGEFDVELSLSGSGRALTVVLTQGDPIEIEIESFDNTDQIGGIIEDSNGNVMDYINDIDEPTGTFGGDTINASPYITDIAIENGGDTDYIDIDDRIIITFSEAIRPESVNNGLELDDNVYGVDDDDTGGVNIEDDGMLTINDIAKFYVGDVDDDSEFEVKIALNSIGNVLTITLTDGEEVEVIYEEFDDASQIGGTIEDKSGNDMEEDPRISDPEGSF